MAQIIDMTKKKRFQFTFLFKGEEVLTGFEYGCTAGYVKRYLLKSLEHMAEYNLTVDYDKLIVTEVKEE